MSDVSVVIPCYNAERFIEQTVRSALDQGDIVGEVLVIDDGSTDASADKVRAMAEADARVVLIQQANAGESRARNVGIEKSIGKYVAFLDADDVWMPGKCKAQIQALESHPDAAGVHSRIFNFRHDLDDSDREVTEESKDNPSVQDLISYHWITPSAAMLRRDTLIEHNLRFDEAIRHSEDMLFFADVRMAGPMRLVDDFLLAKRMHDGAQSQQVWHRIYSLESRTQWLRQRREKLVAQLGEEVFNELEQEMCSRMLQTLEDAYWRRKIAGFRDARRRVAKWFPKQLAANKTVNRFILPRWIYKVIDKVRR